MAVKIWIIGFFDMDRPRMIFSPFLKPGFRHATAFGYDVDKGYWLSLDWGKRGLSVNILDNDECDRLIAFIERHHGRFLEIAPQKSVYRCPILPCWCVTAIRHLLGIKRPYFTPYQLYCAVKRMGGKPIFEADKHEAAHVQPV